MTREEAIKTLRELWRETNDPWYEEVYNMAIEALTQDSRKVTQESTQDLISRQDVVNEIHKYFVEEIDKTPTEIDEDGDELYADMPTVNSLLACNKELSKRIKSLPSAEPKTGKWMLKEHLWECDQCGCRINRAKPLKGNIWNYNFCPNCGARMTPYKGGEDE